MNRALLAGLSGTLANQTYMDVLGNNIANANTVGFKEGRVTFQDAYYQTIRGGGSGSETGLGGTDPAQIGSGTTVGQIQTLHTQGSMRYSGATLDAAIEGGGMFVLSDGSGGQYYTRDGSFTMDSSHTLIAGSNGMRVLGWKAQNGAVNTDGQPGALTFPIGQVEPGQVTKGVEIGGNLDAGLDTDDTRTTTISVYDSLGMTHAVALTFTKSATANEWGVDASCDGTTVSDTVTFDPADGSIASGNTLAFSLAVTNGAATPLDFSLNLDALTQLNQAGSNPLALSQDGTPSSTLSSVTILDGGDLQGEYSDGHVAVLGRIAVASFANEGGLIRLGNNLYQEGANTGVVDLGAAGTSGRGQVRAQQLEMSNVDLTRSFVEIMTAQRGFQASTRVIAAANSMLDDVMQLNVS